jgi:hypothetical protein
MPILLIAQALAQFAPAIAGLLGGKNAEAVAGKVVEIAQTVTGAQTPDAALQALQGDSNAAAQFRKAVLDQQVELERLAVQNAADVNATMRTEAAAEHWPTYGWRPAIGFAVAIDLVGGALVTLVAYAGVMFCGVKPEVLSYLPGMLGAMAALVGVASPILGIASWFRGKMQADPNVPTVNRG